MYYVYFLKSLKRGKPYIGYTNDLKRRLEEHNEGQSTYTNKYKPWRIETYVMTDVPIFILLIVDWIKVSCLLPYTILSRNPPCLLLLLTALSKLPCPAFICPSSVAAAL